MLDKSDFSVKGQAAILQVYVSEEGFDYFVPFVDATAPEETYGAGRYLEPGDLGDGKLYVDFNLAYNPYCAYNDNWSCPLPPKREPDFCAHRGGRKEVSRLELN